MVCLDPNQWVLIMCPMHASKTIGNDEILEDKSVFRKVWINRDEIKQIQK